MSTVFLGTSELAAVVLERLARDDTPAAQRPALVITRPDRPRGRGRRLGSPPVADMARKLGIALEQPDNVNDPHTRALIAEAGRAESQSAGRDAAGGHATGIGAASAGAAGAGAAGEGATGAGAAGGNGRQTVIVCAFGALIKEPLLSEHELLNVHPSLLPRWRGAAPIERAIMAGDAETGVSIMRLTAGLDSGPVCLAARESIRPDDSYGSLAQRLAELGGELLVRALGRSPEFVEQAEDGATYAEKIGPEDRLLDPTRPAAALERIVRALHPHIGARVALADGGLLGVRRAALVDGAASAAGGPPIDAGRGGRGSDDSGSGDTSSGDTGSDASGSRAGAPGDSGSRVAVRDGRLLLACNPGELELLEVQPPGGRAMDAQSYLRGHDLPGRR